jgi:hypothetical protein
MRKEAERERVKRKKAEANYYFHQDSGILIVQVKTELSPDFHPKAELALIKSFRLKLTSISS